MSVLRRIKDRAKPGEDLGLDRTGAKGRQSIIGANGSYNMERKTGRLLGNFYPYHWLITTRWSHYWLTLVGFYLGMNMLFAVVYFALDVKNLSGVIGDTPGMQLLYCFFFSAQSFTTVGYGGIHPTGIATNFVAVLEAFIGLMTFVLATGTLYGRFSRPVSRIKYSNHMIIAPFGNITGLQFMVANEMNSGLMEMEARINLSWVEEEGDKSVRRFQQVKLEIDKIAMFPTSWTINHPIDEESALYGKTMEEMERMDVEVFILLKGFDDVFSQTIYSRHSYTFKQFVYGARFRRPFYTNEEGKVVMDLTKVGEYDHVAIPHLQVATA